MVKEQNIDTGDYLKKYMICSKKIIWNWKFLQKIYIYKQFVIIFLANFIEV